jgi:AcrR family transcriptional regulator
MEPVGTRESLLDAAESLFSEHGVQAASLRAITQRAGANLAAVHYHFGSKQGLVRAVFQRRIAPLNRERLRRLAECEAGGGSVEGVLYAFVAPLLQMSRDAPDGAGAFARLMGRAFSEPSDEVRQIVFEEFSEMVEGFKGALGRLLPHLSESEVLWRFHFVAGAMAHTVGSGKLLERCTGGRCGPADVERTTELLVHFLAAGLEAPATPERERASA